MATLTSAGSDSSEEIRSMSRATDSGRCATENSSMMPSPTRPNATWFASSAQSIPTPSTFPPSRRPMKRTWRRGAVLMDQSSRDDPLVGVGPPRRAPGEAVSSQSSRDKRRKLSPRARHDRTVGPSVAPEREGRAISARSALETFRGYRHPEFHIVQRRRRWLILSGIAIALSLIGLFWRGLNYSIDFTGGERRQYQLQSDASVEDIRGILAADPYGRSEAEVQIVGADRVSIRTTALTDLTPTQRAALIDELAAQAGIAPDDISAQVVGPTWGEQITRQALVGLIVVLAAITLYITLGFSLYDTVVIYDKVKENTESTALLGKDTYEGVANTSMNQVLMRSVNTSLVVVLPILSLLLF